MVVLILYLQDEKHLKSLVAASGGILSYADRRHRFSSVGNRYLNCRSAVFPGHHGKLSVTHHFKPLLYIGKRNMRFNVIGDLKTRTVVSYSDHSGFILITCSDKELKKEIAIFPYHVIIPSLTV